MTTELCQLDIFSERPPAKIRAPRGIKPIQGASALATPAKQNGLVGMFDTISVMRKNSHKPIVFADFYCGSGVNAVNGEEINGSPISMLEGIYLSCQRMKGPPAQQRYIVFNDIVSDRVLDALPIAVESWQARNRLPVDRNILRCTTKDGIPVSIPITYVASPAQELCNSIDGLIRGGAHVVALVDPNGPKDAPWEALKRMFRAKERALELIIHVSSNTLKRVSRAREATGFNFSPMPNHVQDMLAAFTGCGGWIREPVGSDQWTMLLLSKFPPYGGWNCKNGPRFLLIDSTEGSSLIRRLSTTRSR